MRIQGIEWWRILGLEVGIRAKAQHPISHRCERDGSLLCHSAYGVLPSLADVPVKFVK